jgi:F0F1-type ATP synthase membrane subunit c/vacuolar-type H+-ATPase subunit K
LASSPVSLSSATVTAFSSGNVAAAGSSSVGDKLEGGFGMQMRLLVVMALCVASGIIALV